MKKLHLLCNAHLDPLWQWEFDEGAGAVLSTFRAAADFCDEFDGFVFNHNEALIYEWVERYDPALFTRIQKHVKSGKWHIMGGWYLQPDCNMPSGESIVRQIEEGNRYFREKFGVRSKVAINFDPFGHSRGMVQILQQAGYIGYICCRPYATEMYTPARECLWQGFNDSSILVHRSDSYNQPMGKVDGKIGAYLQKYGNLPVGMVLWGVGNHGGGPSREDLRKIADLQEKYTDVQILHSTPEQYFEELEEHKDSLYRWSEGLNPTMPGCYTSQVRIKQAHRWLENELYLTEKMCVHAHLAAGMPYPTDKLEEAQKKLLFAQFHDILPGSSIREVEEQGLQILHHGLNLLRDIKVQAFFWLCVDQKKAEEGAYPVLVYNPHPFPITDVFETEFMLADQDYDTKRFDFAQVYQDGKKLPTQNIQERSHIPIQWRKRVAFRATLKPFCINRFDIRVEKTDFPQKPVADGGDIRFENDNMTLVISGKTGLIERYCVGGIEYAAEGFGALQVYRDNEDPWGMVDNLYSATPLGKFRLVQDPKRAAQIAAATVSEMQPLRIIESGDVLVKVEAIVEYEGSTAVICYEVNRFDSAVKVRIRIANNLKDRMIKLMLPLAFRADSYRGKIMFGVEDLDMTGKETVSQEYVMVSGEMQALSVIKTGCYGGHFKDNTLSLSLLRSPSYCAHPIGDRKTISTDRCSERVDQGERDFTFVIQGSSLTERQNLLEQESQRWQQIPQIISYFPGGEGAEPVPLMMVDHPGVSVSALKQTEDGKGYILRLFNSQPETALYTLESKAFGVYFRETLKPFEIRTLLLKENSCAPCGILDDSSKGEEK